MVDFRFAQGGDGHWFAFWAANDNLTGSFNIMVAPMYEPIMAWDGGAWVPSLSQSDPFADPGFYWRDFIPGSYSANHLDDLVADATSISGLVITFPRATYHVKVRVSNVAISGTNQVALAVPTATDIITSGNPVTAATAASTTVTITTFAAHNLVVGDLVTISGAVPTAYNGNFTVVTVPSTTTFTYTALSAPGTNTTLPAYDRGLRPGETRVYWCRKQNLFQRVQGGGL
jgi:hypothetical protein